MAVLVASMSAALLHWDSYSPRNKEAIFLSQALSKVSVFPRNVAASLLLRTCIKLWPPMIFFLDTGWWGVQQLPSSGQCIFKMVLGIEMMSEYVHMQNRDLLSWWFIVWTQHIIAGKLQHFLMNSFGITWLFGLFLAFVQWNKMDQSYLFLFPDKWLL